MLNPNHFLALNNLAYALAIRKNDAAAALPLAKRAYAISVSDPAIGDTLAWIYHLLGDDAAAAPIIVSSARRAPAKQRNPPPRRVHTRGTDPKGATEHLDAAIRADAALAERDDVRGLRKRLEGPRPGDRTALDCDVLPTVLAGRLCRMFWHRSGAVRADRSTSIPWAGRGVWLETELHTHTRFTDGGHTVEDVVAAAARNGCDVVAITDHGDGDLKGGDARIPGRDPSGASCEPGHHGDRRDGVERAAGQGPGTRQHSLSGRDGDHRGARAVQGAFRRSGEGRRESRARPCWIRRTDPKGSYSAGTRRDRQPPEPATRRRRVRRPSRSRH